MWGSHKSPKVSTSPRLPTCCAVSSLVTRTVFLAPTPCFILLSFPMYSEVELKLPAFPSNDSIRPACVEHISYLRKYFTAAHRANVYSCCSCLNGACLPSPRRQRSPSAALVPLWHRGTSSDGMLSPHNISSDH